MANPVFESPPADVRQDSLPHPDAERLADVSELSPDVAVTGDAFVESHPAEGAGTADAAAMIPIQVCYATPETQTVIALRVAPSSTIKTALRASGILDRHPEIDLSVQAIGVFGKIRQLDDGLAADDRIEIYRPLIVDPKVARARRVAKTRKGGSSEGRKWATRARRSL